MASDGEQPARANPVTNVVEQEVTIPVAGEQLGAILGLPQPAAGVIPFAHGSGSGRFSPRNRFVAGVLQRAGFATLLLDLLTPSEANDRRLVFDIPLLADRLEGSTEWVKASPSISRLPIGYFGASTGAGAAMLAAADEGQTIGAVVSRGGRPDLADGALSRVTAPTLLIIGGNDQPVIALNRQAFDRIRAPKELVIVPGATHLFEEPGTLEEVARLATDWFTRYLRRRAAA